MAHDVQTREPTTLIAGDSWAWDRVLPGYRPADGWTLRYALRGATDLDIDASGDEAVYRIRVAPSTTGPLEPGAYRLVGYVESEDARHVVYEGTLVLRPNPVSAVNAPTHAEQAYEIICRAIEGRLTEDEESFQVGSRQVSRIPIQELYRLRGYYAAQIQRERSGGQLVQSVGVRFVPA